MKNLKLEVLMLLLAATWLLSACKPPDSPPPDILKTQRESLNKAKALEGQMQQQVEQRMKSVDDEKPHQ